MSNAFVGTASVDFVELKNIVRRCLSGKVWQFLRWPHQVKLSQLDVDSKDFFECQEGQVFNQTRELRWQRKGDSCEVLLLSDVGGDDALSEIEPKRLWKTQDLNAMAYPSTETRLPQPVKVPDDLDLGQRYFMDAETACVHFVALRVK
jgi:hypothetical protein